MGATNEQSEKQNFNNKRSNKPLMERKRRERINKSLDELKDIILKAENKDASKYAKLEKADILEMTVRHVTNFHQNPITTDGVTKYMSGFSHCTSEMESYLTKVDNFPPHVIKGLLSRLHEVLNSIAKENIPQQNHKVKATTDKSILGCRPIRPKRSHPLEPICPQFGSEIKPRIQATTVDVPRLPSPPSDCSVSPLAHRLTPNFKYEIGEPQPKLHYPPLGLVLQDRRSALTCNYIPRDMKPLNLTLHEHMTRTTSHLSPSLPFAPKTSSPFIGGEGHSLPRSFQEPSLTPNLPPTPPSEQLSPISHLSVRADALLITSSRSASPRAQFLKDSQQRPAPYPKKDAVKRYHSQMILRREKEDIHPEEGDRGNDDKSSSSHWRPW